MQPGTLEMRALPLNGEITDNEFCLDFNEVEGISGFNLWFKGTFDARTQWVPESEDFDKTKEQLAAFLSKKIQGPYYVHEGFINTRSTLHVTFFTLQDGEQFGREYPKWEFDPKAHDENKVMLEKRIAGGWKPTSVRLKGLTAQLSG